MSRKNAPDSQTVIILFCAGAALVVAALTFALIWQWRTFDPLVTAAMIGVGLLLIVIYERLGHIHTELRTIGSHLERIAGDRSRSFDGDPHVPETSATPHAK